MNRVLIRNFTDFEDAVDSKTKGKFYQNESADYVEDWKVFDEYCYEESEV